MSDERRNNLLATVKRLPSSPGVYLFKNDTHQIIYIGKAKNLKSRVSSYFQQGRGDVKADTITSSSLSLEYMQTDTELEAMLLEAKLIQSHQPKHNVIFKTGQPFVYIMISVDKVPELKLVRMRKKKGTYFGPFIEKSPARKVFDFLVKTFRLKLCGKKVAGGCLYFHLGICSGSCKPDFSMDDYVARLELARKALKQGHKKFLHHLEGLIAAASKELAFEKARELHGYYQAFERVFSSLDVHSHLSAQLARKDIWILTEDRKALFLFGEDASTLKKKALFYIPFAFQPMTVSDGDVNDEFAVEQGLPAEPLSGYDALEEQIVSYYRTVPPASAILMNFDLKPEEQELLEKFLPAWYESPTPVNIIAHPTDGHYAGLVRMASIQAQLELEKQSSGPQALKRLLGLPHAPRTIDCFDISHKQGTFQVGSAIRFKDGEPDKNNFRRFKIKTVDQQDDYACLREIVWRRYQDRSELPDLIVIDGGKGQLSAVSDLFEEAEFISLAKREETIYSKRFPQGKILDQTTYSAQLLMALRDYTHHFAITYHRKLARVIED